MQVLLEAVNLPFSCQAMVTELLPSDNCGRQAMVAHERWSSVVVDSSAAPQLHEIGTSSVHGRQGLEDEISLVILHTYVTHSAYVHERDKKDLRNFTIASPY